MALTKNVLFLGFWDIETNVLTHSTHALKHRGQATGMVSFDGQQFNSHRGLGHVGDNFNADHLT